MRIPRFRSGIVIILPLAVAAFVWWLAGLQPGGILEESAPGSSAPVAAAGEPLPPASFGLVRPAAEEAGDGVFAKFDGWATRYLAAADQRSRDELMPEGVSLAQQRRAELRALIEADPERALSLAVPWSVRKRMPGEVAALFEERISGTADYAVCAAVPAPGQPPPISQLQRSAIIGGEIYDAFVYGMRSHVDSKRDLPVEGIAVDDKLAILDRPVRELEPGEPLPSAPPHPRSVSGPHAEAGEEGPVLVSGGRVLVLCCAPHQAALEEQMVQAEHTLGPSIAEVEGGSVEPSAWTEGNKAILVMRVDFVDVPGEPRNVSGQAVTPAFVTGLINGAAKTFIEDASYRKASISINSADVTDVLRLPQTAAYYATNNAYTQMQIDARAAAQAAGFTLANYDRQMLVFSWIGASRISGSQFTWAGLGNVGGPFTWYNGYLDQRVVPHELGHNYGLRHANLWQVTGSDPVALNGNSSEYADPVDCMGAGSVALVSRMHFNPWFTNRLDWLPTAAVRTVTAPGTYRVYRYDHPDANLNRTLALRMAKDSTRNYWIGYRRRFVGTSLADMSAGAYIGWGYNLSRASDLIDVDTPGTNANDASLNVGATLTDSLAGIQFRVTAAGGTGIDEYIDIAVTQPNRIYPEQTILDVDESAGSAKMILLRSGEPAQAMSVLVATVDATAVAPGDYTATSQAVTWAAGDAEPKTVTIPIVSDAIREVSEHFNVTITAGIGSAIVAGSPVRINIHEAGALDSSFAHGNFPAPGSVRRLVLQPEGLIPFVGAATSLAAVTVNGVGELRADGNMETLFNKGAGADALPVVAVARQADGALVVGGSFSRVRGVARNRVARLTMDGDIDVTFNPGTGPNGDVKTVAIQPDGKVLVGGAFTAFNGVARRGLVRLHPDGVVDTTFLADPIPDIETMDVETVVLQPDGKVLAGGLIHTSTSGSLFAGGFSSGILRLNTDGTVDVGFNIGAGAHQAGDVAVKQRVHAIAVQSDGKIVLGGGFTGFRGVNAARLVRLQANGTNDAGFTTALGGGGADLRVRDLFVQADGRILVAGDFNALGGTPCLYAGRLLASGARDPTFDAGLPLTYGAGSPGICYQMLMQPDTRVLIATDASGSGTSTVRRVFSGQPGSAGTVEFAASSFTVNEGGATEVQVNRVGGSLGRISVSYALAPGSAGPEDFSGEGGETLVWNNGDTAPKFITVSATGDSELEATEFFTVMLGTPIGGTALGAQTLASVSIIDPGAAGFPLARFAGVSTVVTESVSVPQQIEIVLSDAATATVTVPIQTTGGTATLATGMSGGDYSISATSVAFAPGETSKVVAISIRQDSEVEGVSESIRLTLGQPAGPALRSNPFVHTVTILDDDLPPSITAHPANLIVAVGQPAGPFESGATGGVPMTMQWKKNKGTVSGAASSSFIIPQAQLSDAGTYIFHAKNSNGAVESKPAELIVVDTSVKTLAVAVGAKVTMNVGAAGNGMFYRWRKLDADLPGGVTGNFEKALTIGKVTAADSGTYVCQVRSIAGNMDGGIHVLHVFTLPPDITPLDSGDALPPAMVSETYNFPVPIDPAPGRAPSSYAAAGLPAGLKIDAKTGRILGKPTAVKLGAGGVVTDYAVRLTAANGAGKDFVDVTLRVVPLTSGLAGVFAGSIDRNTAINGGLGGRFDLTTTATGAFSGKITLGSVTHSIKGALDTDATGDKPPQATVVIPRVGKPPTPALSVTFTLDPENDRISAGSVSDGADEAALTGWRNIWNGKSNPADRFDGYYTLGFDIPPDIEDEDDVPKGSGFASLKVALAGTLTLSGKTADGESLTGGGFTGPQGQIVVFQTLYTTKPKGSLHGALLIGEGLLSADDRDNTLGGALTWLRPLNSSAAARTYKAGFGPVDLAAVGGRYLPPVSPARVLIANPATGAAVLAFHEAGIASPPPEPGITVIIGASSKLTMPPAADNPRSTTLKLTAATGAFNGGFKLSGTVSRAATFQGLLIPDDAGLHGRGFFLLPQLPTPGPPATTAKTAPILSGQVTLEPAP